MRIAIFIPALALSVAVTEAQAGSNDAAAKEAAAALTKGPIHDLSDSIAKLNARLAGLEREIARANRNMDGSDLPGLTKGQAEVKGELTLLNGKADSWEKGLKETAARAGEASMMTNAAWTDVKHQLEKTQERLAGAEVALAALPGQWDRQSEAFAGTEAANSASAAAKLEASADRRARELTAAGWTAAAALVLLICAAGWADWRGRRQLQTELLLAVARVGSGMRRAAEAPAGCASLGPGWSEIEARLLSLIERWDKPAPSWTATAASVGGPAFRDGGGKPASEAAAAVSPSEEPTAAVGAAPEPSIAYRLLWPAEFLDPESPLSRWRAMLESHFANEDHPALPVVAAMLGLRTVLSKRAAAAEIGAAVFTLSQSLHAYWNSLTDLSADDRQQASSAWLASTRAQVAPAAPRVDLREVMMGARVDPDLMIPVKEGAGNHLNVAAVFSWAVMDRGGDRPKILHRAQIATT